MNLHICKLHPNAITPTYGSEGAADLLTLIEAYAEARHCKGHSSYNAQTATALQAVKDALAAGQATAAKGVAYAALPDEREAFESWLRSVWTAGYGCPKFDSGKYVHGEAQRFWECWQARASHGQAPAGATEPTEQQILEAAEKAGLWPNTVHSWIPAFHRYHKELAKAQSAPARADSVLEDARREVLMEHSGCGSGTQVEKLTVRLNPGDKVVMLKGRITQAIDAARKQGATHDR